MAVSQPHAESKERIDKALANANLQLAIYSSTARLMNHRKHALEFDDFGDFQELRTQANAVKKHAIENLDYYLEQFESKVEEHGGETIYCSDATEVADFILALAKKRGVDLIVKSKSMTTEELDLNERVEHHQLTAVETDLGEYIIQLLHSKPSHIVAPALHLTRYDVAGIFTQKLGVPEETQPEKQTMIARGVLREKFLAAGMGITGANFLVADSGAVVVVENEGNARLTSSAPKIHVAIAGIEKIIPRAQDLPTFLKLLGRSATGQLLTSYTSFLSGPRRGNESDGPEEFYVILVDNGRTKLLENPERRQSLYCIRCGACLNHCPVYRKIGGHSYPWIYSGPIGAIITPQFHGTQSDPWLPFASSLCGACGEVCPVKIDIPRLLLELRADVQQTAGRSGSERFAFRMYAWLARHPRLFDLAGRIGSKLGTPPKIGPLKGWLSTRDLPAPAPKSFRQLWKERERRNA